MQIGKVGTTVVRIIALNFLNPLMNAHGGATTKEILFNGYSNKN